MEVGSRIKSLREKNGLSQVKLARRIKFLNQSQVCKVENGDRILKANEITAFAKALGVPITELLGEEEKYI